MSRPFDLFPNECKIEYKDYKKRQDEYRIRTIKLVNQYSNITILDPEKIYCDDKYCYAIKQDKMLYADDDHHSVDGSIVQAKYFIEKIMDNKALDVK